MINIKYKNIYEEFIKNYEKIHVNPWHEISKQELNEIYENLTNNMDITNGITFKYFMDYIIKRLSGKDDAHTKYWCMYPIPLKFKILNNNVYVTNPDSLYGYKLTNINGISIDKILNEIDEVIAYGTKGKKKYEEEKSLFNLEVLFGLPLFRNTDILEYVLVDDKNNIVKQEYKKSEEYKDTEYDNYKYGVNNASYKFIDNALVYTLSSVQPELKDKINESIENLKKEDISNIDTIIIDLQGNWGGNSSLANGLIDYVKNNLDKKLIVLIDYRVFSAGRHILAELKKLGAIVIGEEISTPMNAYGNNTWICIDGYYFMISEWYLQYSSNTIPCEIKTKEEFNKYITKDMLKPIYIRPDEYIYETEEDFIKKENTILNYALEYSNKLKKNR